MRFGGFEGQSGVTGAGFGSCCDFPHAHGCHRRAGLCLLSLRAGHCPPPLLSVFIPSVPRAVGRGAESPPKPGKLLEVS